MSEVIVIRTLVANHGKVFSGGPKVTYYVAIPGGDPENGSLAKRAGSRLDDVVVADHAVRRSSHSTSVIPA